MQFLPFFFFFIWNSFALIHITVHRYFFPSWLTSGISASIAHTITCALFHFKISLFYKQLLLTPFGNLKPEQKAGTCSLLYIKQHGTKICCSSWAGCQVEPLCFLPCSALLLLLFCKLGQRKSQSGTYVSHCARQRAAGASLDVAPLVQFSMFSPD